MNNEHCKIATYILKWREYISQTVLLTIIPNTLIVTFLSYMYCYCIKKKNVMCLKEKRTCPQRKIPPSHLYSNIPLLNHYRAYCLNPIESI